MRLGLLVPATGAVIAAGWLAYTLLQNLPSGATVGTGAETQYPTQPVEPCPSLGAPRGDHRPGETLGRHGRDESMAAEGARLAPPTGVREPRPPIGEWAVPDPDDPSEAVPWEDSYSEEQINLGDPLDADSTWPLEQSAAEREPIELGESLDADANVIFGPADEAGIPVEIGVALDADASPTWQGPAADESVLDVGEPLDADALP